MGYAMLNAGLLGNGFASPLAQFAATVFWSVGDLILLGRTNGLVADIAPEQSRARYFSVYGRCWGAAAVIGPFAGTRLLARSGPVGLWTGCAIACAVLACIQPGLRRLLSET
jgi:MFS family permease